MIKYFVRTTGQRTLDASYSQVEYELLVDGEGKPVESFIEQLNTISQYDSVLLEDDLILCEGFKEEIEKVIKKYKKYIINFYCNSESFFTTHLTMERFNCNQCTYYPKGLASKLSLTMKELNTGKHQYDMIEHWALQTLKIPHVKSRPCLVQHIGDKSLINNIYHSTPYFLDYLKDLGVSYEDAYLPENKQRLQMLMEEKLKDYKLKGGK